MTLKLLAQKKVLLSKERAGCSPASMGHGRGCVILNARRGVLPTAQSLPGRMTVTAPTLQSCEMPVQSLMVHAAASWNRSVILEQ